MEVSKLLPREEKFNTMIPAENLVKTIAVTVKWKSFSILKEKILNVKFERNRVSFILFPITEFEIIVSLHQPQCRKTEIDEPPNAFTFSKEQHLNKIWRKFGENVLGGSF